ncbi:efflux RND transporter periplasmic adaptor subunit [Thermophagus sp. OGC60D27]|uniref:efflux RND transporter periplasmic adaptor subunit n=1 Tax=Thermophagus sp. OGC60D27 TaxID=3458415 RepID=UPI004037D20A
MKRFLKPVYYVPAILLVVILIVWSMGDKVVSEGVMITSPVKRGPFISRVISTGQLQAENATSIEVPSALSGRRLRIYEIQVTDIVEEGTVVDSGDVVATLDHSAVDELMTEAQEELESALEAYEDAKIDTNINLSNLRDGLLDAKVTVEEKKLVLEQSIYESPAVQRQARLDLERAERNLEQSLRNYDLKKQQAVYDVARAWEEVERSRERVAEINALFEALDVKAPKPGMVIYSYDRFGNKIEAGSTVSRWAPTIAELPDLSSMISKTYINEIDISKIRIGQKATIGIDAFPEKSFGGFVTSVANIGQVLPDGDAKVFEVIIKLESTDPDLRPAMTTSNEIITDSLSDVLYIPFEGVFRNDSLNFVYAEKGRGWIKQIVRLGVENENYVVVEEGLAEGTIVALTEPADAADMAFEGIEIYEALKKEALEKEKEEKENRDQAEKKKRRMNGDPGEGRRRMGERPEGRRPR